MKKIFSIACAMLMMLSASAANAPRKAVQENYEYIELPIYYCQAYNLDGVKNTNVDENWDKGCFLLKFVDNQEQLLFYTYVYTGGSTTALNADFAMMGIYYDEEAGYVADPGAIKLNGKAVYINSGELNISYRKDVTFGGMALKEYDFAAYVMMDDGKLYCFSVQVPILGINKSIYDKDPNAQGAFFQTTDIAPIFEAEKGSFNQEYKDGEFSVVTKDDYNDYLKDYGCIYLMGENQTTTMSLQFMVGKGANLGAVGIPVGTYTIDGSDNNGTVYASDGMYQGSPVESYAADYELYNGSYYLSNYYYIQSGTVVVENVDGKLKVTVDAKNKLGIPVKAVFFGSGDTPTPPTPQEGAFDDDENSNFTANFTNAVWDTDYFVSNGVVYLDADGDVDASKGIALAFFPSAIDPATVIPAGTYQITNTFAVGTACASTGYSGGYYNQCYAYTAANNNYDKLWFITSGSISVNKTLRGSTIIVNGKNSLGKNVNATIAVNSTPIDNVEAEKVASKRIENGQVIIRRNGVDYNMMGTAF